MTVTVNALRVTGNNMRWKKSLVDIKKEVSMDHRKIWARSRDGLVSSVIALGFPEELGEIIATQLGSPKAIDRMAAYLDYAKPDDIQIIIDEMLAIRSEIDVWKEKKASEAANARYNEILNYGLENL